MAITKDISVPEGKKCPNPPDGGWGWVVVFASFMIHFIICGITHTFGLFFYEFLAYFGQGKGTTAWIQSFMICAVYSFGPIASGLILKFGGRLVIIGGSLLAATSLIVSTFVPKYYYLYITLGFGAGAGIGIIYVPIITCMTCYFDKHLPLATGIAVCGTGLGTFAFAPFIEFLIECYGWKGAMLVLAGLVLNCIVFAFLFRPLNSNSHHEKNMFHVSLLADPVFLVFGASNFLVSLGSEVPYIYVKDRAVQLKILERGSGFLLSIIGICNVAGRIMFSYFTKEKSVRFWFYILSLVTSGTATALSSFALTFPLMCAYSAVFGMTMGIYISLISVILHDLVGMEKHTSAFGLLMAFYALACAIGPSIPGLLYDYFNSYNPGYYFSGIVIALGGLVLLLVPLIQNCQKSSASIKS